MNPNVTSHPISLENAPPGKEVAFSVQATGTQPLSYQWQWKQFGEKGEQNGWQNLCCESCTLQVVENELKFTRVEACNAGYYRCVVSNCAGSEISCCASLTVGKHVPL